MTSNTQNIMSFLSCFLLWSQEAQATEGALKSTYTKARSRAQGFKLEREREKYQKGPPHTAGMFDLKAHGAQPQFDSIRFPYDSEEVRVLQGQVQNLEDGSRWMDRYLLNSLLIQHI